MPKVLYVHITTHVRFTVERSCHSQASVARQQSSARYDGEMPDRHRCTSIVTLKSTRCFIIMCGTGNSLNGIFTLAQEESLGPAMYQFKWKSFMGCLHCSLSYNLLLQE